MKRIQRRSFLKAGLVAGAAVHVPLSTCAQVKGANDDIRIGIVGVNGKGNGHLKTFHGKQGVRVVAVCDPDRSILDRRKADMAKKKEKLQTYTDIREMLDKADVDAVVVAAPDHWHALAGIWSMQAGKDVYVEKPLTYCIWEGRKLVEAAKKYNRIAQTGSQHRTCPATNAIRPYIQSGELGKVQWAYAQVFNRRDSIGKADGPLKIPDCVDYNLYAGPATDKPPVRKRLHYDWHWQWPMGTGDAGNWGAHIIDDVLNITGIKDVPKNTLAVGGRLGYDDDGETPNTLLVAYDVGEFPVMAQFRALPMKAGMRSVGHFRGIRSGSVIQCEKGYYAGGRGGGWVFDNDGKRVKQFKGNGGRGHVDNFIAAVRSRKPTDLNAPMSAGHLTAVYCHTGNMSYRLGKKVATDEARKRMQSSPLATERFDELIEHLKANNIDVGSKTLALGGVIQLDAKTETCTGPNAAAANALAKREYRKPFVIPEEV